MLVADNKSKKLRHVKVYDRLFHDITKGIYKAGTQLPSEPELARMMNVSRMTLRQALALLQEDGVVKNIRGKGNFIIKNEGKWNNGLETIRHPIYSCIDEEIDSVELEFRIEPPTEYVTKILGSQTPVVLIVDRWYKTKEQAIAYSLTFIPIETVSDFNIDLNKKEELLKFLENSIYETSNHSKIKIKYSQFGNISSVKYKISEDEKFMLIEEGLFLKKQNPIIHNKHYLPINLANIELNASKTNK